VGGWGGGGVRQGEGGEGGTIGGMRVSASSSSVSSDETGSQDRALSPGGGVGRGGDGGAGVPALSIQGLRFRYGSSGAWVVDVPEFALAAGEQVLLTGGSGSGKSTLLHLIAGLIDPVEGEVRIAERAGGSAGGSVGAGRVMHRLRGAARDRFRGAHVGMIFQTFNLLHGFSALENVAAALAFTDSSAKTHDERARGLLTRLGLDRNNALPEELSVGQQQRVAVARAVVCRPTLVLADEPTASLDPQNAAIAIELIQQACREVGAALLCVSHDPAMRERFGRVHALESLRGGAPVHAGG